MSTTHVFPVNDLVEHETDGGDCVCGPRTEYVDGEWIIVHHALDGREHSEPDHDRYECPLCSDAG